MSFVTKVILKWLPLAAVVTGLCFVIYGVEQQHYRQDLDDPQEAMVHDAAFALEHSAALLDLAPKEDVSITDSFKPFVIFYDSEGNPIVGNGKLNGKLLVVPTGVFLSDVEIKEGPIHRTLEPEPGVRIASVIKPFTGRETNGYVLAGRRMDVGEDHIARLGIITLIGWFVVMLGTLIAVAVVQWLKKLGRV